MADAVQREAPGSRLSILDDGWGARPDTSGLYPDTEVELVGVRQSRRWHRPESWAQVRLAQATLPRANPVARRISRADAVLDLSAGDSFTDLYGPTRLRTVALPKEAALRAGRPLVLLPQTYGPFTTAEGRRTAERLVRSATLCYARDPWSYERLVEIAGPDADPARLRRGVDVAFALEPRRPQGATAAALAAPTTDGPRVGVNVSGLLLDEDAHARFGLAGTYLDTMTELVTTLVALGAHVFLVPHVHVPGGRGESDVNAVRALAARLSPTERTRTTALPPELDAAQVKWCISRFDWFVGSRMHATIAALSTLTPATAYAYSDKTRGVFETCGVADQCIDARTTAGTEAVEQMVSGFHARAETARRLAEEGAATVARSKEQMRDVLTEVGFRGRTAGRVTA